MSGRNYIGGAWSDARETYEKQNPWSPAQTTGTFASSEAEDVAVAAMAAEAAYGDWSRMPRAARANYLKRTRRPSRSSPAPLAARCSTRFETLWCRNAVPFEVANT